MIGNGTIEVQVSACVFPIGDHLICLAILAELVFATLAAFLKSAASFANVKTTHTIPSPHGGLDFGSKAFSKYFDNISGGDSMCASGAK